jgi:hypothetical protein
MDEWSHILVKRQTHERIKAESQATGMKIYALVENAFPEKERN